MLPRVPLGPSLLLLGAFVLLYAAPAGAQYMFLDATGDGAYDSADVLSPNGPTTFDIWIRTDQNRDGSSAFCVTEDGELTINSYEFTLRVTNGEVEWGTFTNRQPLFGVDLGSGSSSTELHIGYGGGSILPPGTYRLGSLSATPLTGTPGLEFSPTSSLSGVFLTSFGSRCSGNDFDNTLKLGQDWYDTDGIGYGGLVNHPPVLLQPENMVVTEDQSLDQALHATDQDGNALVFQKIDGPPFMNVQTMDEGNGTALGRIRLTPGPRDAGTHFAAVGVSDGVFQDRRDLQIRVLNVNHPPVLYPIDDIRMTAGEVEIPIIRMFDPDGDALTLEILARPLYVSIQHYPGETVTFAYIIPELSDAGRTDTVRLAVTDGDLRDEMSFQITVQSRPALASLHDVTLPASSYAEQDLIASDPDGDSLEFSKVSGPAFAHVTTLNTGTGLATGRLEFRPGPLDVGWFRIIVGVSDGMATHEQALQAAVTTPNGNAPRRRDLLQSNFLSFDAVRSPLGVAMDDLNEDGFLDLAVADDRYPVLTLLLGNGDGTFRWHRDLDTPYQPSRLKVADLNRDGHADLILPTQSQWLSVYIGHGDGTFEPRTDYSVGGNCHDIAVVDLNGDGFPEVLAPSVGVATLQVFLNAGDGRLFEGAQYSVGSYPNSIASGDLDNDGVPDIVLSSYYESVVSLYRGAGDGTLLPPTHYPVAPSPGMILVTDLNGDGNQDVASGGGAVDVLLGDGQGSLMRASSLEASGPMALGDFDRDGIVDLAVSAFSAHVVTVFRGAGNGEFAPSAVLPTGAEPRAVLAADLDLDGWVDLVTANAGGALSILFGQGDGAFTVAPRVVAGHRPRQLVAAALDGDGDIDLVAVGSNPEGISVWLNTGKLGYVPGPPVPVRGTPQFAVTADWNGDSVLDVAYSRSDQSIVTMHWGVANGAFSEGVDIPLSFRPADIEVGDLNQDSKPDLVVAPDGVLLNSGNGSFTLLSSLQYQAGYIIAVGLIDGDSYPDVVSTSGSSIWLAKGRGDGTFVSGYVGSVDQDITALSISDWNQDGRADLAVTAGSHFGPFSSVGPGSVVIFHGLGNGTFAPPSMYPGGGNPTDIKSADVNGDGHHDLVVCNGSSNTVSLFLNNGNGAFAPKVDYGTGSSPASLAIADLDGDQRPDVVTADYLSATITLLRNTSAVPNRPPAADAGGPYRGMRGVPVVFSAQNSADPDGEALAFRWDFGDARSGAGMVVEHTYDDAGAYRVTLEVRDSWFASHDSTSAEIADALVARAFRTGSGGVLPLGAGPPTVCIKLEPVDNAYANSDLVLSSIVLISEGTGSVEQIECIEGKSVTGTDSDRNGIEEVTACFRREDLRSLFDAVSGREPMEIRAEGLLTGEATVQGRMTLTVIPIGQGTTSAVYPNPLNPTGILSFHTSRAGRVRVTLLDVQGRRIASVLNESELPLGYHDVPVGSGLASGVYFYRIESPDGVGSGRFTVLK